VKIFHYSDVRAKEPAKARVSKVELRWLITKEMGAQNFAMRLFEIEPGGHGPLHMHP